MSTYFSIWEASQIVKTRSTLGSHLFLIQQAAPSQRRRSDFYDQVHNPMKENLKMMMNNIEQDVIRKVHSKMSGVRINVGNHQNDAN